MRFEIDEEQAFDARRDELGEQFAGWLNVHRVAGDPNDAELLMDWKFGYGDGALDSWAVTDVEEFLFDWCVPKLAVPPKICRQIPLSVAAFVEFLAHTGLLAPGGDLPSQVRHYCETNRARFVREMANPPSVGLPTRLFGGAGGRPLGEDPPEVSVAVPFGLTDDDDETPVVGPVRLPGEQERRDAVRAAPALRQLRTLAEYCAPPGRPLTGKGNLRLADARHLVAAMETGDDPDLGGRRTLHSAEDLPTLSWLVHLALEAGVVRRNKGRLIAVARFAELDETDAHEKVVRAAVDAGLSGTNSMFFPVLDRVRALADECVVVLLADLAGAGAGGVEREALVDTMAELLEANLAGVPAFVQSLLPGWVQTQLVRLAQLGVVRTDDDTVALTAAGVPAAIGLLRDTGFEVLLRADPSSCTAAAITDLLGWLELEEWSGDASAWIAAQPDPVAAVDELVAAACAAGSDPAAVLTGLGLLAKLAGENAVAAARRQLGGPHDGVILVWLAERSAIDPTTIDPLRLLSGFVDIFLITLDDDGPQQAVAFVNQAEHGEQLDILDRVWRLHHPRLPEMLDVIGTHHPVKAVAKAARKARVRHRSWLANPAAP